MPLTGFRFFLVESSQVGFLPLNGPRSLGLKFHLMP